MKSRLKHLITSLLGVALFIFTGVMWYRGEINWAASIPMFLLGAILIAAKNETIEGLTFGIIKVKK